MGQEVAVLGVGMHPFGIFPDVSPLEMGRVAAEAALADAGLSFAAIDAVYVGFIGAIRMGAPKMVKELGLTGVPVVRVEAASATGAAAFREACLAVAGGHYERVLVVGFDKMEEMPARFGTGSTEATLLPAAFFAMWAERRRHERGTTPRTLAWIAAKNWNQAAHNPYAHRRPDHVVTEDEVLAARMIATPLTSMMAAPVGGGAAAAVVGPVAGARRSGGRPVVRVLAAELRSETYTPGHVFLGPIVGPSRMTADAARAAYERAGVGPEDVDVVAVHDAFAIEELEYYELLGFAREGEGDRLVAEQATRIGGAIPFSTDGGLIGRGHPGGPTGLAQIAELTWQLRGEAGPRQVADARVGLAHLVGAGSVCTVHILAR